MATYNVTVNFAIEMDKIPETLEDIYLNFPVNTPVEVLAFKKDEDEIVSIHKTVEFQYETVIVEKLEE
jgi:hypothetical protein